MKKRILSLLIAAVMVVGLLPLAAFAAGESVTITVEANKTSVDQGETVNFTVYVQSSANLTAIQISPVFPAGMTYVDGSGKLTEGLKATMGIDGDASWVEQAGAPLQVFLAGTTAFTGIDSKLAVATFACTAEKAGNLTVNMEKGDNGTVFNTDFQEVDDVAFNGAAVTVNKTSYTASEIQLDYTGKTLAIQDKNFSGTAAPTTWKVIDKDDAENPIEWPAAELAKAQWSVDKDWAKVEAGVVSITDVAKAVAGDITVTVTVGGTTKTATVAVTKAPAAVDKVTAAASNNTTALIPTDVDSKDYTYAVDVVDQYGAKMDGETVTWTAGALPTDVIFDATTGKLSVAKTAESGKVTLTATVGGKSVTIEVNVTNISFTGVDEGVKAANGVYGDKLSDMVKINASKITATAGTTVTGTYTLENANDVPAAGDVAYKVVFNGGAYENVTVAEGTVTVAPKEIVVTAKDVSERVRADVADVTAQYDYTSTELVGSDELSGTASYTIYALNEDGTVSDTTVTLTESVLEEPAEYAIVVSGLDVPNANYTLTFSDAGRLEIRKKTIGEPSGSTPPATKPDDEKNPSGEKLVFDDVTENDWFYAAVTYVADNGLMNGVAERTFAPNTTTTRAMIATILWRHAGSPEPRARIADFPDVDPEAGAWYINAVRWCAEQEIVTGYDNGNFGPNDVITREQLVTMLYRYAGSPEVNAEVGMIDFNDADAVGDWAATAMRWAVQTGIINGRAGGLLAPQGLTTRAEVATVMQRFVVLEK